MLVLRNLADSQGHTRLNHAQHQPLPEKQRKPRTLTLEWIETTSMVDPSHVIERGRSSIRNVELQQS
jgi:hypothetical protein